MVFFIPWRVVAEDSGAAHFGLGGALLLDLPGPARRLLTNVADFHFSDIPVRGDDGARSERRCGRRGATGSTAPTALSESRVDCLGRVACSQISGWRSGLYPLARVAVEELGRRLGWCRGLMV